MAFALFIGAMALTGMVYLDPFLLFGSYPGARKAFLATMTLAALGMLPAAAPWPGRRLAQSEVSFRVYLLCLSSALLGFLALAPVMLPLPLDFFLLPSCLLLAYAAYRHARSRTVSRVLLMSSCVAFMALAVLVAAQIPYIKYRSMMNVWEKVSPNENARFLKVSLLHAGEATYSALAAALENRPIPQHSAIDEIRLRVPPGAIKSMASRLPESAKEKYYGAQMLYPDGTWKNVDFRMRGRNIWHWLPDKPSLRIKLKKSAPLGLQRHINLVNPEDKTMVSNIIGEELAKNLGVLTHITKPVRVFINGKYFGVYHQTTREDEEMLRANHRVPGPLFVGDHLAPRWNAQDFDVAGNTDLLQQFDPMGDMVEALYEPMSADKYIRLWRTVSLDKLAAWDAAIKLAAGVHTDYQHNNLFYFDPRLGRIEPMISDINGHGLMDYPGGVLRYTQPKEPGYTTPINELLQPLMDVALRDPKFLLRRNQILYDAIFGTASAEAQHAFLNDFYEKIDPQVKADRHKGSLEGLVFGWFRMPLANHQYEAAKNSLRRWVENRNRYLLETLSEVSVGVELSEAGDGSGVHALVTVEGNASAVFDTSVFAGKVMADVDFNGTYAQAMEQDTVLPPGLRVTKDPREAGVQKSGRRSPDHYLIAGKQSYPFFLKETSLKQAEQTMLQAFRHKLTGKTIAPTVDVSPRIARTQPNEHTLHPWQSPREQQGTVYFGQGRHILETTLYVGPESHLVIGPGAEMAMGPDVSIVSEGSVEINGTQDQPVVFRRRDADIPWGGILVRGDQANGSVIRHVEVSGGTFARTKTMVSSGMVSIYGVENTRIEHVRLSGNITSDDTLHVVYGSVTIKHATLFDCFGDCIDFDFVNADVEDFSTENSGNDGMDFMTSNVRINNARIKDAGDKGLSVGELSEIEVRGLSVENAITGIAVKDKSQIRVDGAVFSNNEVALDSYRKNWRYGGAGRLETRNVDFRNNGLNGRIQPDGTWIVHASELPRKIIQDGIVTLKTGSAE